MRSLIAILGLSVAGGFGCVHVADTNLKKELEARPVMKSATPVTANQVTADNAHRAAEALWDELDPEQAANPAPPQGTEKKR